MNLVPQQSKNMTVVFWHLVFLFTWNICFSEKRALLRSRPLELYSLSEIKNTTISLVDSMNVANIRNYEGWHILPEKMTQVTSAVWKMTQTQAWSIRGARERLPHHIFLLNTSVFLGLDRMFPGLWIFPLHGQLHWENQCSPNTINFKEIVCVKLGTCVIEWNMESLRNQGLVWVEHKVT